MDLTAEEIRVLGCLVEKQLTTPAQYPLTETALVAACNQATNRDPVVSYDQATVRRALLSLRRHELARMVHRAGDRVEKHRHLLDETLRLGSAEIAVLCVLLLRGPQTVGEVRTRTERMHAFGATSEVEAVLEMLASREPEPLVERMARLPGHNQPRYRHVLGEPESVAAAAAVTTAAEVPTDGGDDVMGTLRAEVDRLRARVEQLERHVGIPDEEPLSGHEVEERS